MNTNKKRFTAGTLATIIGILAIISIAKDGLDLITQYVLPSPTTAPGVVEPTASPPTDFRYDVIIDNSPEIRASGNVFHVPTDNCGSRTSALEEFARSRDFTVVLDTEISQPLRKQIGGDIIVADAELEAAVGATLGVQIGATEAVNTRRQIETPPDSLTDVALQWEEMWQPGYVIIYGRTGEKIGEVPFRVLTTLRLSQIGIQETPCGTLTVEPPGEDATATLEIAVSPASPTDIAVAPTELPIVPTNTFPVPTSTSVPPPEPQPTTALPPTEPPAGTVSETLEVDAYRTALGESANTGVYVQTGDNVDINYLYGQWWIGQGTKCNGYGDEQTPTTAAGYLGRDGERVEALIGCENPNKCRPVTGVPWGSLLGSIGENGALFHIGEQLNFIAQDSGIVHLRINYFNHNAVTGCPYGDGGEITVGINVRPP